MREVKLVDILLVNHVVVDCMAHKDPGGFAGLRRPDSATRYWLEALNIDI